MSKVLFCIDSETQKRPSIIGLKNEDLQASSRFEIYTDADKFRSQVKSSSDSPSIWVYSSDEIDAINIAATCKEERSDLEVVLISLDLSGSLKSRASAGKIDCVIDTVELKKRMDSLQADKIKETMSFSDSPTQKMPKIENSNKAFIMPIISASGGSGKSTIAVISAMLSQFSGYKTLLLDADLQFGDCLEKIESPGSYRLDKLMSDETLINEIEPSESLPAIIGCPKLPELAENVMKELPALVDKLSNNFEVIIINTGSFWADQHAFLLEKCSNCMMLLSQNPSSIQSTKRALELYSRCGISTGSVVFAVNFCSKQALYTSIDISCALGGPSVAEISDGGMEVDEMMSSKTPIGLLREKNDVALSTWNILEKILPARKGGRHTNSKVQEYVKPKRSLFRRRA